MKTISCKQLGGACDLEFHGDTFDEIIKLSQQHGMEMFQKKDEQHLAAMQAIQKMLQNPAEMQSWFESKKAEFESLPDN